MNYSLVMKQLQLGYLELTMKGSEGDQNTCLYCWKSDCGCGNSHNIKEDSFINLTTASEFEYAKGELAGV